MPDPRKVDFKPRWRATLTPEDEAAFDAFEGSGGLPTEPPRIDTRSQGARGAGSSPTQFREEQLESLEGRVTALDIVEGKILLTVQDVSHRVKGNFAHMFTPLLLEALNRQVKLQGIVERRGKQPAVIHIHNVEILDA